MDLGKRMRTLALGREKEREEKGRETGASADVED